MSRRRSIEIPGVPHRSPIPMGARVGRAFHSSGIPGVDPETGRLPPTAAEQAHHMFRNMATLLRAGGATLDDVVRVTVFIKADEFRPLIDPLWLQYFPEDGNRPARHILIYEHLKGGMLVQLEFFAELASDD